MLTQIRYIMKITTFSKIEQQISEKSRFFFFSLLQIFLMSGFIEKNWISIPGCAFNWLWCVNMNKIDLTQICGGKREDFTKSKSYSLVAMWNVNCVSETPIPCHVNIHWLLLHFKWTFTTHVFFNITCWSITEYCFTELHRPPKHITFHNTILIYW